MNDISKTIKTNFLPVAFVKDGHVKIEGKKGDDSYEDYLRELLNHSKHFMILTKGNKLERPLTENNGENDATSEKYSIDFKLILGNSAQKAIANTSRRISTNKAKSIYFDHNPRGNGEYKAVRLHALLRDYNQNELREIIKDDRLKDRDIDDIERTDISCFLKSLMYNKNLFLFFPVVFYKDDDRKITMDSLCELLFEDFQNVLRLRTEKFPKYDTYFAIIYEKKLMIAKHEKNNLIFIENVELRHSKTFNRIKGYYDQVSFVREYL